MEGRGSSSGVSCSSRRKSASTRRGRAAVVDETNEEAELRSDSGRDGAERRRKTEKVVASE